jgi:hypothetical protein
MKLLLSLAMVLSFCLPSPAAKSEANKSKPEYDAKGNLLLPPDYRDWEFLSAGYGMNYNSEPNGPDLFSNVFVQRWAYQQFLNSGRWPEQTTFVIDLRKPETKGSINQNGRFQTDLAGLVVETKDSAHNPQTWAYYFFSPDSKNAQAAPKGNVCYACHDAHAAVEHTFVQFYPTLKPVAKKFGTYNQAREQITDAKEAKDE